MLFTMSMLLLVPMLLQVFLLLLPPSVTGVHALAHDPAVAGTHAIAGVSAVLGPTIAGVLNWIMISLLLLVLHLTYARKIFRNLPFPGRPFTFPHAGKAFRSLDRSRYKEFFVIDFYVLSFLRVAGSRLTWFWLWTTVLSLSTVLNLSESSFPVYKLV